MLQKIKEIRSNPQRLAKLILSLSLAVATIAIALPSAQTVFTSASTKKLPIYCVDTSQKKIALTFDAAWGNGR